MGGGSLLYPRPRLRGAAAVDPGIILPANPVVRLWPFHWQEQSGVNVLVSPRFVGPAVIESATLQLAVASPLPFPTVSLYYASDNGGGGANQATGTVPTGTRIFENLTFQRDDANVSTDNRGFNVFNIVEASSGPYHWPLRYLVTLSEFFVKLRIQNQVAAGCAGWGYLRVLEAIPPEQVPNFL